MFTYGGIHIKLKVPMWLVLEEHANETLEMYK
jgi:hypothetical protein